MAQLPPGLPRIPPPPPPPPPPSWLFPPYLPWPTPPPPPPSWLFPPYLPRRRPPPPPSPSNSQGQITVGVIVSFATSLFAFLAVCIICRVYGHRRARAAAIAVAAETPRRPSPSPEHGSARVEERPLRRAYAAVATPTTGLPAFMYSRSVKHNLAGGAGGEEAATCSVCLGEFQLGETVRLLPVRLHLYHAEC